MLRFRRSNRHDWANNPDVLEGGKIKERKKSKTTPQFCLGKLDEFAEKGNTRVRTGLGTVY